MDVIGLNINLLDCYLVFLAAEFIQIVTDKYFGFPFKYFVSIFWTEYYMILAQPQAVRQMFVL